MPHFAQGTAAGPRHSRLSTCRHRIRFRLAFALLEMRPWLDLAPYLLASIGFAFRWAKGRSLCTLRDGSCRFVKVHKRALGVELSGSGQIRTHYFAFFAYDGMKTSHNAIFPSSIGIFTMPSRYVGRTAPGCCRSRYFDDGAFDRNAKVFTVDGVLKRDFLLGDGIKDVQATTDGRIWVCYFDEGIFGSLGWKNPIGARGFVLWNRFGSRIFTYSPPQELGLLVTDRWLCD